MRAHPQADDGQLIQQREKPMARKYKKKEPAPMQEPDIGIPTTEDQVIEIPAGQPFSMSIMVKPSGIAIGLRYGHGSESHPNFGKVPQGGGISTMGGGPGGEPGCD
jgi:hypothetical protein